MTTHRPITGSNIPGYFLGRPRSVYLDRFRPSAQVTDLSSVRSDTEEVEAA